jgi:hypothetical protein
MELKPLGANMTEVITEKYRVLFSYRTPVAYVDRSNNHWYKTIARWSNTTTRHINKWNDTINIYMPVEQETLNNLLKEVK